MAQDNPFDQFDAPAQPQGPQSIQIKPPATISPLDARRDQRAEAAEVRAEAREQRANASADRQANVDTQKIVAGLRDDYNRDPAVKKYGEAVTSYASALESAATPQGDLNLIYAIAKVMDPESVVREGEQAAASNTDTLYGRTVARLKKELGEGGTFSDQARSAFRQELAGRMRQLNDAYLGARVRYKQMADASGFDPFSVVGDHAGRRFQDTEGKFLGRPVKEADYLGNPVEQPAGGDRGTLTFNDQIPEKAQAPRLSQGQEAQIMKAIQAKDAEGAISLMEQFTGNPRTADSVASVNAAVEAVKKGVRVAGIGYDDADRAYGDRLKAERAELDKVGGARSDDATLFMQGGSLNFSDEIAGAAGSLGSLIAGNDPVDAYKLYRDVERQRVEDARKAAGWRGTAIELGSGMALPVGAGVNALRATTLGQRVAGSARAGALGGAIGGFGAGEGLENSLLGAGVGAAGGAAIGSALPMAGQVIGNRVGGLNRLLGRDPELPRRLVGEAITADQNTPRAIGNALAEAQGRGSPMMIADTGDNARQLLASVGRQPGPSRTLTREAVIERQHAQQERIASAVVRDLGPTANVRETGDRLIEEAQAAAAPLYERAYAAPGASSVQLDDIITRPSMQQALGRARRIASEEGRDPTALGFDLDAEGNTVLARVPSFQTLDYMKQGMDDFIESFRDPLTGVLRLNKEGRAANNTLRAFLARVDRVNPAYAEARRAYAGPASLKDALDKGSKALSRAPDDLTAEIRRMSEPEREMYRLGLRRAITDMLEGRTDGSDKVQALIGTPKKRAALMRAFGDRAEFNRFIQTLRDEADMGQTYRAVTGNSATAERQAFDQQTADSGLAETAMDSALRGGKDGMWSAGVALLQRLRDVDRFGAGQAGQRAREGVAALLSETDPTVLAEIARTAQRAVARQRAVLRGRSRAERIGSNVTGRQIGSLTAPKEPEKRR